MSTPIDMVTRDTTRVNYDTSQELMDLLRYTCENLSLEFERWGEQYIAGPSLYFLVVADVDFVEYTDPLGANKWPVDRCGVVTESTEPFIDVARDVAFSADGAVVIAADGTIQEQMVRVRSPNPADMADEEELAYADWMGTKHLSALEISTREEVLWAVTLSEEDGRVTSFLDGSYQDYPRDAIGGRWRPV
jgi:diadenylate cyclase